MSWADKVATFCPNERLYSVKTFPGGSPPHAGAGICDCCGSPKPSERVGIMDSRGNIYAIGLNCYAALRVRLTMVDLCPDYAYRRYLLRHDPEQLASLETRIAEQEKLSWVVDALETWEKAQGGMPYQDVRWPRPWKAAGEQVMGATAAGERGGIDV